MMGNNPSDSFLSFEPSIQTLQRHRSSFGNKKKFHLRKMKATEKKLKSSESEFTMFSLVNVKANLNFRIHQIKSLALILAKMFHVTSLVRVGKNTDAGVYLQHTS